MLFSILQPQSQKLFIIQAFLLGIFLSFGFEDSTRVIALAIDARSLSITFFTNSISSGYFFLILNQ